jgi:predicted phage terminase large subunit-like protein
MIAEADGYGTRIVLPQDPAQAGLDQATSYIRLLNGYRVSAERVSGDKAMRADAVAAQCNIGRISMARAPWNSAFTEELAAFPLGRFDDQVDALASAFNALAARPRMNIDPMTLINMGILLPPELLERTRLR